MVGMVAGQRQETSEVARHIARVAAQLFAKKGFDATSVRTIVEAAGVTKPTLYYHFGSKAGLGQALFTVPMTELERRSREILRGSADPIGQLEALVDAHFDFCREDPDRGRFVYALFFGPLGSGLAAELAQFGASLTELMREAAEQAAEAEVIARDRTDAFAAALRGLIVVYTMDFLYRGIDLGPELARRLVADLIEGFQPRTPGQR